MLSLMPPDILDGVTEIEIGSFDHLDAFNISSATTFRSQAIVVRWMIDGISHFGGFSLFIIFFLTSVNLRWYPQRKHSVTRNLMTRAADRY